MFEYTLNRNKRLPNKQRKVRNKLTKSDGRIPHRGMLYKRFKHEIIDQKKTTAQTYVFRRCERTYAEGKVVSWLSDETKFRTYCTKLARAFKTLVTADALHPSQDSWASVRQTYLVFFVALGTAGSGWQRQQRCRCNQGGEHAAGGHTCRSRQEGGEAVKELVLGLEGGDAKEIKGSDGGYWWNRHSACASD
jgi:hypothetical protein